MSTTGGSGRRRLRDVAQDRPLRGGMTGIALVALATLVVTLASAAIVGITILLLG